MKKLVLFLCLFCTPVVYAQMSAAGGFDVRHDPGKPMFELRYFGEDWPYWSVYTGTDQTFGIELYYPWKRWEVGLGTEFARPTDIVDTRFGYQIRFEYKFNKKWSVGIKHRSNCRDICNNDLLKWARVGMDYIIRF